MAYPAGIAMMVEITNVRTATMILLPVARRMPVELRKNSIDSSEIGSGTNDLGKARTSCGVLKAMFVINQMGSKIQIASTIATA